MTARAPTNFPTVPRNPAATICSPPSRRPTAAPCASRSASITGSRKTAASRPISNRRPAGWRKPPSGSRCPTGPAPLPEAKASACGTAARTSGSGTARRSGRTNSSFRTRSSLFHPNKAAPFDGWTETLYNLGD